MVRSLQNSALPQVAMQSTEQAQSLQPQLKTATVEGASRPVAEKLSAVMLPRDEFSPSSPVNPRDLLSPGPAQARPRNTISPGHPFVDHGPVQAPGGFRVEGLSLEAAAALLRKLTC